MLKKIDNFLLKKDSLLSTSSYVQHSNKKLSARERIDLLLDKDSFVEHGLFIKHRSKDFGMDGKNIPFDGVITGYGTIFNRPVFVFSQDFSSAGGSLGEMHAKKILNIQNLAINAKIPLIGIQDSGGARIQEGVDALAGYGDIFQNNINASGLIPQISLIMGPCAGGAVYSPALTDFTIMVDETSFMFITGPDVVKEVNNEDVTREDLGGSHTHAAITGACDNSYFNDLDAIIATRKLFSFISQSCFSLPEELKYGSYKKDLSFLNSFISDNSLESYDMKTVILSVIDDDFFELKTEFAKNIIIGFARIEGQSVGIVANQPLESAGCLDVDASRKAARFIRFCDCFNIPIVSFVDTPGFLPGLDQEHNNIIQHGAKLLYAYGEATVPKITIITRKAYGGAYIVMGSKHLNCDINYAWPTAEIAVLGSKPAAKILFKNIKFQDELNKNIKDYEDKFLSPYFAAERGYIDSIIKPEQTRDLIIKNLKLLSNKKKLIRKHDNLPI